MMLRSLRLKNIRSYVDEKIDFPEGTSLLSGDIGCGKSTILMAVDFAIFGLRTGELTGTDLLRHGHDDGFVELELTLDSKDMKIRRHLKRGSRVAQESCTFSMNGRTEALTPLELKARMLEMLGYPQELVRKNRPLFRYTVYTPQEEMKRILADEESRLAILRKIFGIDKYGTVRENARRFLTELRAMRRELDAYSSDLEAKKSARKQCEASLKEIAGQLSDVEKKLSSVNSAYSAKISQAEQAKSRIAEMQRKRVLAARKESELMAAQLRLNDTGLEIDNIDSKIQFNINLITEPAGGSPDDLNASIRLLEKDRDGMMKAVAVIDSELDRMSVTISKGVCSFCNQPVSDPQSYKQHIGERESKKQEIMSGIRQADEQLGALREQRAAAERYHAVRKTVEDLKTWKRGKEAEKQRLQTLLPEIEKEFSGLKTSAADDSIVEQEFEELEKELEALRKEKLEHEKLASRLLQQKADITGKADLLDEEIRKKEEMRQKTEHIVSLLAWFDNFILLTENIEKHVLLTVQREFDQYFQHWFSMLMPDALYVRIDERFSPVIEQNGYETGFENLSGGEKTAVSLAYRLALNKVVNIMIDAIRTKDLLILDEPTDGFSTEQLDRVRDVIHALGLKQVILVSHEPKMDTYVESVIKVYKENHVSRVAQ